MSSQKGNLNKKGHQKHMNFHKYKPDRGVKSTQGVRSLSVHLPLPLATQERFRRPTNKDRTEHMFASRPSVGERACYSPLVSELPRLDLLLLPRAALRCVAYLIQPMQNPKGSNVP
jgi:hypothetical protein